MIAGLLAGIFFGRAVLADHEIDAEGGDQDGQDR
jgi:hypothetical protein